MADVAPEISTIPTFSLAERDRRWAITRVFLEREGLDALIVVSEHEDAGAAPFHADMWFSNDRPGQIVLFPREGDPISIMPGVYFAVGNLEDVQRGNMTPWFPEDNLRFGRHSSGVAEVIKEMGLTKSKIGVLGLNPYSAWLLEGVMPYNFWNNILTTFPDAEFKSVWNEFAPLMMPLSDEGIAVLRHSAMIGDAMAKAMVDTARPGVTEAEVFAAGMSAAYLRGTVPPHLSLWSGPSTLAIGTPSWAWRAQVPRTLQNGDKIISEAYCYFGGLHTQHQITIAIGEINEEFERAAVVTRECYDSGLKALRPGARFSDVAEALLAPVEKAGGWVIGPQIHGLNPMMGRARVPAGYPVDNVKNYSHPPGTKTAYADMVLMPGMSFQFEPTCGFGRQFAVLGGPMIVGEDEPIELSPYTGQILRVS